MSRRHLTALGAACFALAVGPAATAQVNPKLSASPYKLPPAAPTPPTPLAPAPGPLVQPSGVAPPDPLTIVGGVRAKPQSGVMTPLQIARRPGLLGGRYVYANSNTRKLISYYRLSDGPAVGGRAEGWMVAVLRKPFQAREGRATAVATLFTFDCVGRSGFQEMTVFYQDENTELARMPVSQKSDEVYYGPGAKEALMRIACDEAEPGGEPLEGLDAVIADTGRRLKR